MRADSSMCNLQPSECPTLVHAVAALPMSLQLHTGPAPAPCSFWTALQLSHLSLPMRLWLAAGASMHLTQRSKAEARPGQLFRVARLDPEASMLNERRLQAGDSQRLLHLPKPCHVIHAPALLASNCLLPSLSGSPWQGG